MCAEDAAAIHPKPRRRRQPRSPTVSRKKKVLANRFNPNVQVAGSCRGSVRRASTGSTEQPQRPVDAEQDPESENEVPDTANTTPQQAVDTMIAGCMEGRQREECRLEQFLAAVQVRNTKQGR